MPLDEIIGLVAEVASATSAPNKGTAKKSQSWSQKLTAALEEINEAFTDSPKSGGSSAGEAALAQKTEVEKLNEHIDWLLNNKKKLESEIAELKSAPAAATTPTALPVSAADAVRELRQESQSAVNAIVLSEIIAPPLSKRSRDFSKRVTPTPAGN